MVTRQRWIGLPLRLLLLALITISLSSRVSASYGDRLPAFQQCIEVSSSVSKQKRAQLTWRQVCEYENCREGGAGTHIGNLFLCYELRSSPRNPLTIQSSPPPPPPPLDLSSRMRLHLPTNNYRAAPLSFRVCCSIPRQMAIFPLPGHARALFGPLFPLQLPRPL